MRSVINTKELCKYIRNNKKRYWIWQRQEKQHLITDRNFLVRFDGVPNDVLASLFSVFFQVPTAGETLISHLGERVEQKKPINFDGIYKPTEQDVIGKQTPYMRQIGRRDIGRVISLPDRYTTVNETYYKMSFDEGITTKIGDLSAIYMANNDLMILPYRISDEDKTMLIEIMELEI